MGNPFEITVDAHNKLPLVVRHHIEGFDSPPFGYLNDVEEGFLGILKGFGHLIFQLRAILMKFEVILYELGCGQESCIPPFFCVVRHCVKGQLRTIPLVHELIDIYEVLFVSGLHGRQTTLIGLESLAVIEVLILDKGRLVDQLVILLHQISNPVFGHDTANKEL